MVREILATRAKTQTQQQLKHRHNQKHCRTDFSSVKLVRESGLWPHSDMISHRAEKENRVFSFVNELGFLSRPLDLCTFTQNEVKYYPVFKNSTL
jgi:hypothetical protein